jgi:hypothetical protein
MRADRQKAKAFKEQKNEVDSFDDGDEYFSPKI